MVLNNIGVGRKHLFNISQTENFKTENLKIRNLTDRQNIQFNIQFYINFNTNLITPHIIGKKSSYFRIQFVFKSILAMIRKSSQQLVQSFI